MESLFATSWSDLWGGAIPAQALGAVYTRPEIVELILDLAGYVTSRHLAARPLLEPSCGDGAFVLPVVDRLVASEIARHGERWWEDPLLDHALRAVDLNADAVRRCREATRDRLVERGAPPSRGSALAGGWIQRGDTLLTPWRQRYDFVVGNPPYVRLEDVPRNVMAAYRERYDSLVDRADVYVAFLQCGMELLSDDGVLAFITANRFTKNQYGRAIRKRMAQRHHVRAYLNLEHTQPFLQEVSAYPAIVVIDQNRGAPTRATTLDVLTEGRLAEVRSGLLEGAGGNVSEFAEWYPDGSAWVCTDGQRHDDLRGLSNLPTLEESAEGTRIGIGVATGVDRVFVCAGPPPDVEPDRLLPLVMAADVRPEGVAWSGHVLVNPFAPSDDGSLASLDDYPRLGTYFRDHEAALRARHVSRARPSQWYRTIDRVWAKLQAAPKLLLPDIQAPDRTVVGYDEGRYYPHHNVYFITSRGWDLRALQALLRSARVREQVGAFSVQMRGGSLRWQAQTLRRVRVPSASSLPTELLRRLAELGSSSDVAEINLAADAAFEHALRASSAIPESTTAHELATPQA